MSARKAIERILTQHPAGKHGVNIARDKYDAMRTALMKLIPRSAAGVAFAELPTQLAGTLDKRVYPRGAAVKWYLVAVKQDLEARGLIEQVPGARPQRLRRVKGPAR